MSSRSASEEEALDHFDDAHTRFEEVWTGLASNADGDPYGP
jgi:hypothetical protein